MIHTYNYTEKQRLYQTDVTLSLRWEENDKSPYFDASFHLDYDFPPNSRVYIEATKRQTLAYMRFDFGTVSNLYEKPKYKGETYDRLDLFSEGNMPEFKLKIVDHDNFVGRILGDSANIPFIDMNNKKKSNDGVGLLTYDEEDLGEVVWKIKYPDQSNEMPILTMNSNIPRAKLMFDQAWAYPMSFHSIIKDILTYIVIVEGNELDSSGQQWYSYWLRFMSEKIVMRDLPMKVDDSDESKEERMEWIDDCVAEFCNEKKYASTLINEIESQGAV